MADAAQAVDQCHDPKGNSLLRALGLISILSAFGVLFLAARADALTLYASTAAGTTGELYILDSATGAVVQDVGPLNDLNNVNYPITGLAFQPHSGVLLGSTGNSNPATAGMLVKINPVNGASPRDRLIQCRARLMIGYAGDNGRSRL